MEAVFFDWDGTLVDSLGSFHRANAHVMTSFGLPFDERIYRQHYVPDWRLMYTKLGVPGDRLDEANEMWHAAYATEPDVIAFDGVAAALDRLAAIGLALGIVTAGHRAIVLPQLEATGLGSRLPIRVFGDDLIAPSPVRAALRNDPSDRPALTDDEIHNALPVHGGSIAVRDDYNGAHRQPRAVAKVA